MRQITAFEKEQCLKEQEKRRNSRILVSLPAEKTNEEKQWRESVEKYLCVFDLIAIPTQVLRDWKKEF
jgi:hypothetical protein